MMKNKALYIHVPFCEHICYYCDFCHLIYNRKFARQWLDALKVEKEKRLDFEPYTIYIGGGTPVSLDEELLEELLILFYPYSGNKEYTVEVNPESLTLNKAKLLKKYGVNRISIGLESSNEEELKSLGRKHNYKDVKEACMMLKEVGIDNINLDILYSFPNQTMDSFKQTIEDAYKLNPNHLSLYSLTIEDNTVFGQKKVQTFDDEKEAIFYEYAVKSFKEHGYHQYEVANFAKKGEESKHNQVYWHYEDFLGLSMGASSKLANIRSDNTRSLKKYLAQEYISEEIILDKEDMMFEMVMMNLRLEEGLLKERFYKAFDVDILDVYKEAIDAGIKKDWLKIDDKYLRCKNREILNSVLLLFMK